MTVHVCDAECRRRQAESRLYNSLPNTSPLLAELDAAGLADDPLAVTLRALRAQDASDRRWAEGEKHSEARAGRDAATLQDVARVRVARRRRDRHIRPFIAIAVVLGRAGTPGKGPVHAIRVQWLQNGAVRESLCGKRGRAFKTKRAVTCPRCRKAAREMAA